MIETDIAIVGANFNAALLARILHQKTLLKVDIFESSSLISGSHHFIPTQFGAMEAGLKVIPHNPQSMEAFEFFETVLVDQIIEGHEAVEFRTFEKGEFARFFGFGERRPEAINEWDYYLAPEKLLLKAPISSLVERLLHDVPVTSHLKSEVTHIDIDGEHVQLLVNGDTIVKAKAIVLCGNPHELFKLLPQNRMDPKIRQRISKIKKWTSLSLNFVHRGEVSDFEDPLVFTGSGEVPFVVMGRFEIPRQETGKLVQMSQWLTLVSPEEGEEEDVYAHSLREMKKLISKAFPKIEEGLEFEKIIVKPGSHGMVSLKFEKNETLRGFENLWVCHPLIANSPNIPGGILRTRDVAEALLKRFEASLRDLPESTENPSVLNLL